MMRKREQFADGMRSRSRWRRRGSQSSAVAGTQSWLVAFFLADPLDNSDSERKNRAGLIRKRLLYTPKCDGAGVAQACDA